jgi:hypothetical protein
MDTLAYQTACLRARLRRGFRAVTVRERLYVR